jgi:hypothetical protein
MVLHDFNNERQIAIEHTVIGVPDITSAIHIAKLAFLADVPPDRLDVRPYPRAVHLADRLRHERELGHQRAASLRQPVTGTVRIPVHADGANLLAKTVWNGMEWYGRLLEACE